MTFRVHHRQKTQLGWAYTPPYCIEAPTSGEVRDAFPASQGWIVIEIKVLTLQEAVEHARANSKDR